MKNYNLKAYGVETILKKEMKTTDDGWKWVERLLNCLGAAEMIESAGDLLCSVADGYEEACKRGYYAGIAKGC